MIIRPAVLADKDSIVLLMDEFNTYYYQEHILSEEFQSFWEYKDKKKTFEKAAEMWLSDPKYIFFVAEENGKIVGYICGFAKERDPRVLDREGYIDDWFVSGDVRGNGVGRQLYEALLEKFKEKGCNRLGLLTNIGNKKAIDFYHRLGFIDESLTMVKKLD
jgi:ribosomal protein S18 acetylase RimI-like enzyme